MTTDDIPEHVRRFITEYIDSVEQLRVLLLLFENPDRRWSVGQITRELRSSDGSITKRIEDLHERGLLARDPAEPDLHTFEHVQEDLRATVRDLAEANASRPYRVIELIYARPNEALRAFADAFKIKKDEKS